MNRKITFVIGLGVACVVWLAAISFVYDPVELVSSDEGSSVDRLPNQWLDAEGIMHFAADPATGMGDAYSCGGEGYEDLTVEQRWARCMAQYCASGWWEAGGGPKPVVCE